MYCTKLDGELAYIEETEYSWVFEDIGGTEENFTFVVFGPPLTFRNKPR